MKYLSLILILISLFSCTKDEIVEMNTNYTYTFDRSAENPNNEQYKELVSTMIKQGVPGVMMTIYTPTDGLWLGAGGYSCLNTKTPMLSDNITRVGSTVKTFTAVTILQLQEQGKLSIDDKITSYLPASLLKNIANADQTTIRQLLQHTSGIFNYIQDLRFQTTSLNYLIKEWSSDELLDYARNKNPYCAPGTDCRYSNTGYILLGKIIESICQRPFYEEFESRIFTPLAMRETQFASKDPIPAKLVRGYVDFFSTMKLINSTYYSGWDYHTADGGLISNPYNLSLFMKGLFDGTLLSSASLSEMLSLQTPSVQDPDYYKVHYGLGIFQYDTDKGTLYGHSGDAIGYYATMFYHPASGSIITWATNGNYGKLDELISSKTTIERVLSAVIH